MFLSPTVRQGLTSEIESAIESLEEALREVEDDRPVEADDAVQAALGYAQAAKDTLSRKASEYCDQD